MARIQSSSVEIERLLCLVETQKQHISELRAQLGEALEGVKQHKLQLVQQSPARKNVRKLLQQAASDNTVLSNRVEELRAQRNALCVTKAALTAQVSELIRVAADDRQLQEQHRLLLHQLSQLVRLIQQPNLRKPEEQMAAVVAHIKQLYREREELSEKLAAAMHSSNSEKQQRAPSALATSVAAAPGPAGPLSPTGMKLDQRATSQLIWSTACSNPFTQQQQQQLKGQGEGVGVQQGVSTYSTNCITQDAAAACDTGSCLDSFSTAQSQLFDISPLRGANSSSRVHAAAAADATPSSKTPAALTAADAAAGAVAAAAAAAGDAGTPLSAQSLSAFSPAAVAVASPRRRRALQALSPLRRCDLQKATSDSAAAAGMGHHCSSSGCSDAGSSSSSSSCAALSDLLTPRGLNAQQQQQAPGTSSRAGALMGDTLPPLPGTACSRLGASTPRTTPRSNTCAAFGSSVGLSLGREFRVAAVDSLWPACPAAARGSTGLDLAAVCAGSAVCSHSLWLQGAEEEAGGEVDMEGVDEVGMCHSPGEGVCPRALTDWDFLEWGCGSSSSCGELGGGCDGDVESLVGVGGGVGVATDGGVGRGQQGKNRVQAVVSRVVWVGVSAALAAAGGAAAWRHKQAEVLQVLELAHRGAIMAATQAQRCAAGGVKHLQKCCRGAAGKAGQVLPAVPAAGSQ